MSDFDLLPDDCIIEILLNLINYIDFMALICTCTRVFKISHTIEELRKKRDCYVTELSKLFEGRSGRSLLVIKEKQAASVFFGNIFPTQEKFMKKRYITHLNLHKLKYLCKIAGNIIAFSRKKNADDGYYPANNAYIKIHICWITNEFEKIEIINAKGDILNYENGDWYGDKSADLSEFYSLYEQFYKNTPMEKFPGKLLCRVLQSLPES